jgi:hypothetical protein
MPHSPEQDNTFLEAAFEQIKSPRTELAELLARADAGIADRQEEKDVFNRITELKTQLEQARSAI